ncbi:uncharacterized protein BYT42DRAFT_571489 [Radiomyces spectabilis]|uniref:uncharacterized protein n=1 Tax=Radiomyces spectabilis TaxID=64574 RepID=UPI0022207780|nr:uncharacterized protein BYT42DRAFT_571489 [Radiomyces spectabilis]KAI8377750.1 hypothetical protein BYT42DRAFT_571489 [Radiomyces spectabilis]
MECSSSPSSSRMGFNVLLWQLLQTFETIYASCIGTTTSKPWFSAFFRTDRHIPDTPGKPPPLMAPQLPVPKAINGILCDF